MKTPARKVEPCTKSCSPCTARHGPSSPLNDRFRATTIAAIKSWPRPAFFIRRSAMLRWQVTHGVGRSNIIFHDLSSLGFLWNPPKGLPNKNMANPQRWNQPPPPTNSSSSEEMTKSSVINTSGWATWQWELHPRKLTCPLKRDYFNRKYIFQPSFFRGYVSFQGGRL